MRRRAEGAWSHQAFPNSLAAANSRTFTTIRFASASICGSGESEGHMRIDKTFVPGRQRGSTISKSGLIPMAGRAAANIPNPEKPKPIIAEPGGAFADDFSLSSLNVTALVGRQS